jgi:hypothetical protein
MGKIKVTKYEKGAYLKGVQFVTVTYVTTAWWGKERVNIEEMYYKDEGVGVRDHFSMETGKEFPNYTKLLEFVILHEMRKLKEEALLNILEGKHQNSTTQANGLKGYDVNVPDHKHASVFGVTATGGYPTASDIYANPALDPYAILGDTCKDKEERIQHIADMAKIRHKGKR